MVAIAQAAKRTRGIYASPRRLSCGLLRPVNRHARRIAAAPAVAARPFEAGKRPLDQLPFETAFLTFRQHRAQAPEPDVDGEADPPPIAPPAHGLHPPPAHLHNVRTTRRLRR